MKNAKIQFITRTAAILAITIVLQSVLQATLGSIQIFGTVIVGTAVCLGIFAASRICGILGGSVVAVLTPVMAALLGRALWIITPFIAAANLIMAVSFSLIFYYSKKINFGGGKYNSAIAFFIGGVFSSLLKFGAMMIIGYLIAPNLVGKGGVKQPMITVFQLNFSYPQLLAAVIGFILAFFVGLALIRAKLLATDYKLLTGNSVN